jgi:hypothetical protein
MALTQAVGQLSYIRPYVDDFTAEWLITNSLTLTAGAMILVYVSSCWHLCAPESYTCIGVLGLWPSHCWVMTAAC